MPYSQGRMLVRLNALKDNVLFRSLSADQVTSVTLNLMSAGGGGSSSTVIMAYQFTGADSWTPTGATFSGVQASSYALPYCGTTMAPDDSVCSLNVTSIAEGWLGFTEEATTKASQGIILLNSNSVYPEFSRRFYGSQSFTGVLPTVTVTYTPVIEDGTYFIVNQETNHSLQAVVDDNDTPSKEDDSLYAVANTFYGNESCQWTFTLQPTGYYTIQSVGSGLYLSVPSNDTTGVGGITLSGSATARGSFWAVIPTDRGGYALMASPVASNSGGQVTRVLSLPSANASGGTVGQYTYVNEPNGDNQQDEWFIGFTTRLEPQKTGIRCWVAVARMVSMNYLISSISQDSAAVYVKLGIETTNPTEEQLNAEYNTKGGNVYQTEQALEYIMGSHNVYSAWKKIYNQNTLASLLDLSVPIILSRGVYSEDGTRRSGHCTVVYDCYLNDSGVYVFKVFDPLNVNIGSEYEMTYQEICEGESFPTVEYGECKYIWDGIVVVEEGDYLNTIDWVGV